MRSCQDITLKDIQPIQLTQKKARIEAVSAQEKKASEQTTSPVTSTSPSTTSEAIKSPGLSRKAYYESWDKFDVDKALEDFERDEKRSSAKPSSISTNSTKTAPKPLLSKPTGATATDQVEPATMPSDSVAAANAEKEKVRTSNADKAKKRLQ